jgi:hypothetical protein
MAAHKEDPKHIKRRHTYQWRASLSASKGCPCPCYELLFIECLKRKKFFKYM